MSEAALAALPRADSSGERLLSIRIGWRNLWRNRRRTWLTAGGIAFSTFLVVSMMSLQAGIYGTMIENGTALMTGHIQIQAADYVEDNRFEDTIDQTGDLLGRLRAMPGIAAVAPRVEAFALVSADERSFGAQILGIDIAQEENTVRFVNMLAAGRTLQGPEDAVLGTVLARNLGVALDDEIVVLGAGKEGGVAAMVFTISGLLETGIAELDRALLLAPLAAVQDGFGLDDEVHSLVIRVDDLDLSQVTADALQAQLPETLSVRNWDVLLPELVQGIEVDRIGGRIMAGIILALVVFSVVNSFIMTVFERTREFGMLRAIGMRPLRIIVMIQWEAFFGSLLGVGLGLLLACALVLWLMNKGIYLGDDMQEYASQFYMPDRLYPAFSAVALLSAPIVMVIGTQIAAIIPALRVRWLKPVEALRSE